MVGISEQEEREILNETSCMMQLSHPHIISYVGSFLERGSLHIVMEFASGGDLQCLIRRHVQTGDFIIEDRLWKFLIQLTQGLQHAHSRRILHRDIKAQNVFLDANDNIKIGDLGLGKVLGMVSCYHELLLQLLCAICLKLVFVCNWSYWGLIPETESLVLQGNHAVHYPR